MSIGFDTAFNDRELVDTGLQLRQSNRLFRKPGVYGGGVVIHNGQHLRLQGPFGGEGGGHDAQVWKDIISALRLIGYDYVISIEHEDALMSTDEGLAKGVAMLKDCNIFETPGEMFWA